ncbi:hypothetical protein [Kineococcus terrestris]|uniref:hypothetical protein n=1 Tax=Kineococcus terrestris TaxID=2044856 RepID=UPI0034DB6A93
MELLSAAQDTLRTCADYARVISPQVGKPVPTAQQVQATLEELQRLIDGVKLMGIGSVHYTATFLGTDFYWAVRHADRGDGRLVESRLKRAQVNIGVMERAMLDQLGLSEPRITVRQQVRWRLRRLTALHRDA